MFCASYFKRISSKNTKGPDVTGIESVNASVNGTAKENEVESETMNMNMQLMTTLVITRSTGGADTGEGSTSILHSMQLLTFGPYVLSISDIILFQKKTKKSLYIEMIVCSNPFNPFKLPQKG